MTCDMLRLTRYMWHMEGVEYSLKISAFHLLRFGIDSVLKILSKRAIDLINESMSQWVTEGIQSVEPVEQPRLPKVC